MSQAQHFKEQTAGSGDKASQTLTRCMVVVQGCICKRLQESSVSLSQIVALQTHLGQAHSIILAGNWTLLPKGLRASILIIKTERSANRPFNIDYRCAFSRKLSIQ